MFRGLRVLILTGALLAAAQPALADVRVSSSAAGIVLSPTGINGWRVIVEHYSDGSRNGARVRQISFGDPTIFSNQSECTHNPVANDVVCDGIPLQVQPDREDDAPNELVVGGSSTGCEAGTPVVVFIKMGGGGDDVVRPLFGCGGQANVTGNNRLSPHFNGGGGDGNDLLTGGRIGDEFRGDAGNDTIAGGTGDDKLAGGTGNDTITGQGGSDTLVGDAGADLLDGGGQSDTVRYDLPNAVTVTLDGAANDGRAGEGDNVRAVETVITGSGADTVTGSSADETLEGGAGNDTLTAGAGTDTVRGGDGSDLIDVRENNEGIQDTVSCGSGSDQVIADLSDVVPVQFLRNPRDLSACERVERFAVDDGPPGRIRARSVKIARDGRLALRLSCPARARVTCRGSLRLADPRRPARTLTRMRYSVRRRASGRIRLRLSRAQARRMRARGAITAITSERGVSKKGPRSTTATLRVGNAG